MTEDDEPFEFPTRLRRQMSRISNTIPLIIARCDELKPPANIEEHETILDMHDGVIAMLDGVLAILKGLLHLTEGNKQ